MCTKMIGGLCLGFLGMSVAGVSAAAVNEFTTFGSWAPNVSGVNTTLLGGLPPGVETSLTGPSTTFGPGTFVAATHNGYIFNDNVYGTGIQYIADSPQDGSSSSLRPALTVSFNASAGITALSFAVGTYDNSSSVDVSVNGAALSPVFIPGGKPESAFIGITDTLGPIKSITFTSASTGEIDLVGSYSTATAKATARAPELDTNSMASALALLFGAIAVLRGRERQAACAPPRCQ